LIVQLHQKISS